MASQHSFSEDGALLETRAAAPRLSERRQQPGARRQLPLLALALLALLFVVAAIYHYAIYLPEPDLPHRLTLLDDVFALGVVGLVGLVGLALGRRALRPFKLMGLSRLERGALAIGLGWGLLSLAVLALGLAHLLYSWLLIAGLALACLLFWRDAWLLLLLLTSRAPYQRLRVVAPRGFFLAALLVVVLVEGALVGIRSLALPYELRGFDVYQYHWAVPRLYLLHHMIYALPGWAHANFPFNSEMLNTLALAFDSPEAALYLQAAFGLLAILLIAGFLYRRFGLLAAWLGLALCLCNQLVDGLLTSGYAEDAVIYYGVASALLLLLWVEQDSRAGNARLLALAGLFAGFGLGAKYTGLQMIAGEALLVLIVSLIRGRRLAHRRLGLFALEAQRLLLKNLAVFGAAILLVFWPWLLKDWVFLGNPVYPLLWGGPEWDQARTRTGVVTLSHFGPHGPLWQRLLTGIFTPFFDAAHADDPPYMPPNYFLLLALLALPGWVIGEIRQRMPRGSAASVGSQSERWALPALVILLGGYLSWVLSGAAVARYGAPWLVLLSVPSALVLTRIFQVRWRLPGIRACAALIRVVTPVVFVLVAVLTTLYAGTDLITAAPLPLVSGNVSLRQWEQAHLFDVGYWKMVEYVEQRVPHDERLLLVGRGTGYFLDGFDYVADSGDDWIPYLETEGHAPAGILLLLQRDHFRYLIYDEKTLQFVVQTYGNSYLASFLPAFRQFLARSLIQVWSYQNFAVYRVPSP